MRRSSIPPPRRTPPRTRGASGSAPAPGESTRVRATRAGLRVGDDLVPLFAGSVHYWRMDPRDWRAALTEVRKLGLHLVDTYVPWGVHELSPGELDWGERDPSRDVAAFLRIAHEVGLYAIVRPGPHINAELTFFGIPERILWDPDCQARSPRGNPVMLPMLPVGFPVPSYASEAFHDEVRRWYGEAARVLAPLRWPDGPIVLVQVDNEGSFFFRDGAYDQDWRPEAVKAFRAFLRDKYRKGSALREAWRDPEVGFPTADPPTRFDAEHADDLARHLDWAEFHEQLLANAFGRMARGLREAGLDGVPTVHNLPFAQETTPLNPARIGRVVDVVGLDYYHRAGPHDHLTIARRTTELAARCEGQDRPAFACEMGAGFPPYFPPLGEGDSLFTMLASLAWGLRGFNLYMAVERDRWIGAPIDVHGKRRPFADAIQKLLSALAEVRFHELRRAAPVRLVTPRSLRRLARVMHAWGPATGALFAVLGAGARESSLELDLGLGRSPTLDGEAFVRAFEQALLGRGVPFAHVGGEAADVSLDGARWIVCATPGGVKPELVARLRALAEAGAKVTIGPGVPERDGGMRRLVAPLDVRGLSVVGAPESGGAFDPAAADREVARAVEELALPTWASDPDGIFVTVHEDAAGAPRVVFVIHPGHEDLVARVSVPAGARALRDLLDGTRAVVDAGSAELRMPPRTARMLAVET